MARPRQVRYTKEKDDKLAQLPSNYAASIAAVASSGVADGDKGDVVVSSSGSTWTLDSTKESSLLSRANHTGTQAASTISDSTTAGRAMLTAADATAQTALLDTVTSGAKGLAPASGGGSTNFLRADGTWTVPGGGSVALTDLTDVTVSGAAQGQVLARGASEFQNLTCLTFTVGPFFINDMAGTATTDATIGYFNTATALSRNANEVKMQSAGRIVGVMITSDAARTAGTATVAVEVNNGTQAFNGGAVVLDATNTTSNSSFVAFGSGVAFAAGDTIGAEVTTSGWTPTTANFAIWLVVMLTPF